MTYRRYLLGVLVLTLAAYVQAAEPAVVFHVATSGFDNWSGRLAAPNASKTDGPFATLQRARDAVRQLKRQQQGELKQPVTVFVHGGTYPLSQPLGFTPDDSGTADFPVVYAACENERPIFSGARAITGWKQVEVQGKTLWAADIPEACEGKWYFHQLWIDGRRRQRARNPNQGFFRITAAPDVKLDNPQTPYQVGQDRFQFAPGEIQPYENLADVDLVLMTFWLSPRIGIASIDFQRNMVTLNRTSPKRLTDGFGARPRLARYYVENALELLDAPGEWYLDRKSAMLYYMPMPREDMNNTTAVAAGLESFLIVKDDTDRQRPVEHLTFRGLGFEYAESWIRQEPISRTPAQGSTFTPAAIQLYGARHCSFESCRVAHISQYAMHFARGCQQCRVSRCEMFDLGTGGIKVGDSRLGEAVHDIEISDCHIHHGGLTSHSSHAVWIGYSYDNLVAHNHIHDFYYIAISAGWSWGYSKPWARGNIIEYNHIHDIGKGWLSDLGAIYTLGVQPGTIIRYNLLHDIECADYGGSGIYLDAGSAEIVAEKNLVYRTSTGFHQNYGKQNVVRNNILLFGQASQIELGGKAGMPGLPGPNQYLFERNIVSWKREARFLASPWRDTDVVLRNNLYWQEGNSQPKFGPLSWAQWQERGMDAGSIIADPLFVDPAKNDFHLKPESPALKLGFEPFDLSEVGPRQSGGGAQPPAQ